MARTITEIQQEILTEKDRWTPLDELNSISKVSIWRLIIYIIANSIFNFELILDNHKSEITTMIAEQKKGSLKWYRNMALAFQYGFDLYPDSDQFNNEGYTEEQIEASKVVKYSAVTETDNQSRLIIKIATESGGKLNPLDNEIIESFTAYMEEIRYAGVPLTIINYLPDLLYATIKIKRDPLVLDASGFAIEPIDGDIRPVDTTIQKFLRELPFNGELFLSRLTDQLQVTRGVTDVLIKSASSGWIDPESGGYGTAQGFDMSIIPVSGYFTTEHEGNSLISVEYVA
jgi:hypothetical protein